MTVNGTVATREETGLAQPSAALAIRPGQEFWTDKQRAALAVLGIKDATNADLAVFMHYCQKTGLDPFSRQIYMIMRREKVNDQWVAKQTIQTGIDGFRVIRDRIAARLGIEVEYEDTVWYDADGQPHMVWLSPEPPAACRVVVLKNGRRFPAVLRTAAYAATNRDGQLIAQWRTQPEHMIEKCAEAFALRRAFPHDLGGLYVEEELPPAAEAPVQYQRVTAEEITGNGGSADPEPVQPFHGGPRATPRQVGTIRGKFKELGFTEDEREQRLAITAKLAGLPGLESTSKLLRTEAGAVIEKLEGCGTQDDLIALMVREDQDGSDA